mmetsp:Transcript_21647/g.51383  ORF Transcript_21647/g.51383 Transcript_21647/m.51383 type:complete len:173 (-) Transcript_21647:230-748(-)
MRAGLVLELPLIQKRILDEVADFRLYEPKSAAEAAGEAARALADWAELRRRSSLKTNQRQRAHTEARALLEGLQRAHDWSDCAHESLAHLRPLGRHGIEARPSAEHVRLHRALTRMAELDADEAIAARGAADARARVGAGEVGALTGVRRGSGLGTAGAGVGIDPLLAAVLR